MLYYAFFGILDYVVMPEIIVELFIIRFCILIPVVSVVYFLSFLNNFKKWWQASASFITFVSGSGIIIMLFISPLVGQISYYVGIILVLIYGYILIRLRFIWASLTGWALIIFYSIYAYFYSDISQNILFANTFFLVSVNILGMFGSYYLEFYARMEFFQRKLLNVEKNKIKVINQNLEKTVNDRTVELQSEIEERKKIEKQLILELEQRETLLRELYHRTKNNMQIISSMLSMQARDSKNDFIQNSFNEIINKIQSMSLVHQKIYQTKNLSHIDLKEYIEDLASLLLKSFRIQSDQISLKFNLQNVYVLIDTAIPCGLILNELFTNILKHAFPNEIKGVISINLYVDNNEFINIEIFDDGIGISENMNLRQSHSIGLQNIFNLIDYQLKGEVKYESEQGLKWYIKLKDNQYKKRV